MKPAAQKSAHGMLPQSGPRGLALRVHKFELKSTPVRVGCMWAGVQLVEHLVRNEKVVRLASLSLLGRASDLAFYE